MSNSRTNDSIEFMNSSHILFLSFLLSATVTQIYQLGFVPNLAITNLLHLIVVVMVLTHHFLFFKIHFKADTLVSSLGVAILGVFFGVVANLANESFLFEPGINGSVHKVALGLVFGTYFVYATFTFSNLLIQYLSSLLICLGVILVLEAPYWLALTMYQHSELTLKGAILVLMPALSLFIFRNTTIGNLYSSSNANWLSAATDSLWVTLVANGMLVLFGVGWLIHLFNSA
ncbi:MAG: hypothetical protein RIF37_06295 [Rhodospirillaceae bacterium]